MPWFDSREELVASLPERHHAALRDMDAFKHVLTHKDLHLHPVQLSLPSNASVNPKGKWFDARQWPGLGLPAPVRVLLQA